MNKYFIFFLFILLVFNFHIIYAEEIILETNLIHWTFESEHGLLKEIRSLVHPEQNFVFNPPCS
ncbi:MAG: hypothetical protein ACP5QY_14865, partial [Candidatus Hydrogenedens sp.]